MTDAKSRGRFVWFELMTSDPKAAAAFYSPVTGWGTAAWDGPMPYTMWTVNGVPIGGLMQLPDASAPPFWLAHISTPNVDETVTQAIALGARVLAPAADIPTIGRFAVLADPQGATFAAFTPHSAGPGGEGEPALGEFSWHELATHDAPAAFRFYERLFAWEKTSAMDMGPMGTYQMYGRNGVVLGGMFTKPPEMPVSSWVYYVLVDNVENAVEKVMKGGGQIVHGPMDVPGGDRVAQCLDPQGALFALHAKGHGIHR